MPTPYQLALLFVRLSAAMGIAIGLLGIGSAILATVFIVGGGLSDYLSGLSSSILIYGVFYLVVGIVELIFARPLARFAAKAVES